MVVWLILAALAGLGAGQTAAAPAATTSGSTTTTYAAYNSGDLPVDVSAGLSGHPFDVDPGAAFLNDPNDPRQDYQEAPRLPSYTMRTADGRFCFTNYNSVGQRLNDVCKNWEELTEAEKDEVAGAYGATYWAAEAEGALGQGAARVPSAWGEGLANTKGVGTRWFDPASKGNGIRIDEGIPGSSFSSQQVDHVVVRYNGRIIGPDGQPITGGLRDNPGAHIPLSDWLNWSSWFAP